VQLLFTILLIIGLGQTQGHAQRGAQTNMERAYNAMEYCSTGSSNQAAVGRCYQEVARDLAKQLKRALEDRTDEVEERNPATAGGLENVANAKRARKDADAHWAMVLADECDRLAALAFYGGSGQGVHRQHCEINWLAARLDVMQVSPDKYR
jgi:hypothetical protein